MSGHGEVGNVAARHPNMVEALDELRKEAESLGEVVMGIYEDLGLVVPPSPDINKKMDSPTPRIEERIETIQSIKRRLNNLSHRLEEIREAVREI